MDSYSLDDARARLSELIDRVEAGESVAITRGGKRVAKVVPAEKPVEKQLEPIDWEALERLRARMPVQGQGAGEFVRHMRDTDRY